MARITGRQVLGMAAVVGAAGAAARLGRGALGHLMHHHNELFEGAGSVWYSRLAPHLLGQLYRRVAAEVSAEYCAGVVLDVGCGPGHLALDLARRAPELDVRGVDVSADMVRRAQENAARLGLAGQVQFEVSAPARLPLPDASVDLVVTTLSMHHWADVPGMLRELARVVRPGGQAWIYDVRQPAMEAAALAAAVPGGFAAPQIAPVPLWVGPVPLRRFVRCRLARQ